MPQISADRLPSRQGTDKRSHAVRNGLICAFVVAACLWATYPVAEMGFFDDWSYTRTAQMFAQTGHFVYNGQGAMILGWQVVWGALFIKLFGFSFTAARLSMLPIAMAAVFLFHAVLVRFGVNARNAVLGTLALGLSPMFIPLAVMYMTDVAAVFVILLCLYFCQRAAAAASSKTTIAWLCLAAATNLIGGTVRHIVWLGALVMLPSAGWLLRKRRGVLLTSSLLWLISMVSVLACMRWFARQPYSVAEPIFTGPLSHPEIPFIHFFFGILGVALSLLVMLLPISVAWFQEVRKLSRAALLRIALITLLWGLFERVSKWTLPWLYYIFRTELAVGERDPYIKTVHYFLPMWGRELISLLAIAATVAFVEHTWSRLRNLIRQKAGRASSWQGILWLLGPFSLSYFLLLMPVSYRAVVFDRYALFIMPAAIIVLLRLHQDWIAPRLPSVSVAVLAIFAVFAIAATHDWFTRSRARLTALNEIRASGVPRTEIQGGYEYDGWTQTEVAGYINNPWIKVPAGAYHPVKPQPVPDACEYTFSSYTPAIHPKYTVIFPPVWCIFPPVWCLEPSKYSPANYRTWLPPFKGTIYVQEIPGSSR